MPNPCSHTHHCSHLRKLPRILKSFIHVKNSVLVTQSIVVGVGCLYSPPSAHCERILGHERIVGARRKFRPDYGRCGTLTSTAMADSGGGHRAGGTGRTARRPRPREKPDRRWTLDAQASQHSVFKSTNQTNFNMC